MHRSNRASWVCYWGCIKTREVWHCITLISVKIVTKHISLISVFKLIRILECWVFVFHRHSFGLWKLASIRVPTLERNVVCNSIRQDNMLWRVTCILLQVICNVGSWMGTINHHRRSLNCRGKLLLAFSAIKLSKTWCAILIIRLSELSWILVISHLVWPVVTGSFILVAVHWFIHILNIDCFCSHVFFICGSMMFLKIQEEIWFLTCCLIFLVWTLWSRLTIIYLFCPKSFCFFNFGNWWAISWIDRVKTINFNLALSVSVAVSFDLMIILWWTAILSSFGWRLWSVFIVIMFLSKSFVCLHEFQLVSIWKWFLRAFWCLLYHCFHPF